MFRLNSFTDLHLLHVFCDTSSVGKDPNKQVTYPKNNLFYFEKKFTGPTPICWFRRGYTPMEKYLSWVSGATRLGAKHPKTLQICNCEKNVKKKRALAGYHPFYHGQQLLHHSTRVHTFHSMCNTLRMEWKLCTHALRCNAFTAVHD